MATITPSSAFIRRLLPAVILEAIALVACVILYTFTDQLLWIFLAVPVAIAFGAWVVVTLVRHRDEWRWRGENQSMRGR